MPCFTLKAEITCVFKCLKKVGYLENQPSRKAGGVPIIGEQDVRFVDKCSKTMINLLSGVIWLWGWIDATKKEWELNNVK